MKKYELCKNVSLSAISSLLSISAYITIRNIMIKSEERKEAHKPIMLDEFGEMAKRHRDEADNMVQIGINQYDEPIYMSLVKNPNVLLTGQSSEGKQLFMDNLMANIEIAYGEDAFKHLSYSTSNRTVEDVLKLLENMLNECNKRKRKLVEYGAVDINDYNTMASDEKMKPMLIYIEDLSEIYKHQSSDVFELLIQHIIKSSRGLGIYLIISTNHIRRTAITGFIKSIFDTKIAFKVNNETESMIAIDEKGAEKLKTNQFIFKSYTEGKLIVGQNEPPINSSEKRFL